MVAHWLLGESHDGVTYFHNIQGFGANPNEDNHSLPASVSKKSNLFSLSLLLLDQSILNEGSKGILNQNRFTIITLKSGYFG